MRLWLVNVDPKTTDAELREFVREYTKLDVARLTRIPGDGSRPGVLLEFDEASAEAMDDARRRLNGLRWKNRSLIAYVPRLR
jgi:hypothetical protein